MRRFSAAVVIACLLWIPSITQTATAIYCYKGDPPAVYQACLAYNQGIGAQVSNHERHSMRHQSRDEMHVSTQPIELRDQDRTFRLTGLRQGGREFGPALKGICPLAGLDLDMLANEFDSFGFSEALDSRFLGLDA